MNHVFVAKTPLSEHTMKVLQEINYDKTVVELVLGLFKFDHSKSEHGVSHWLRVMSNGFKLASLNKEIDRAVVFWFSLLHDSHRENEYEDPEHGLRAANWVYANSNLLNLDPAQVEQLAIACSGHTNQRLHSDPTIAACWDADRLDLSRVGKVTDPYYLNLPESQDEDLLDLCHLNGSTFKWERDLASALDLSESYSFKYAYLYNFQRAKQILSKQITDGFEYIGVELVNVKINTDSSIERQLTLDAHYENNSSCLSQASIATLFADYIDETSVLSITDKANVLSFMIDFSNY